MNLIDWLGAFRPAAFAILAGQSPYGAGYFSPPWLAALLIPLAILPATIGGYILAALNVAAYALVSYRMRIHPAIVPLIILSAWVNMTNGNIDGLCLLGAILPPQIGLFLLLAKPQIGVGLAVLLAYQAWQDKRLIRTFAPVLIAFGLSFIAYGWYLSPPGLLSAWWNRSLFPLSIIPALILLALSIKTRRAGLALAAGPMLSPYVNLFTWVIVAVGLCARVDKVREKA